MSFKNFPPEIQQRLTETLHNYTQKHKATAESVTQDRLKREYGAGRNKIMGVHNDEERIIKIIPPELKQAAEQLKNKYILMAKEVLDKLNKENKLSGDRMEVEKVCSEGWQEAKYLGEKYNLNEKDSIVFAVFIYGELLMEYSKYFKYLKSIKSNG